MNRKLAVAAAGAATVLVGAGAAFGGPDGSEQSGARCEALVAKIAETRGMSVAELEARIKERLTARVEAALQAGRISAERAAALEKRIAEGHLCKGAQARVKLANRGLLAAAATFLGMSKAELRAALPGTSLAALAAEPRQECRRPRGRNARSRRGEAREGRGGEAHHGSKSRAAARATLEACRTARLEYLPAEELLGGS